MNTRQISSNISSRRLAIEKVAIEVIIAILIIVWLHTGLSKLFDSGNFRVQLSQSPIFRSYAGFITYAGPIFELLLGVLLIFKRTRFWGLIGTFVLMVFFSWYVYYLMKTLPQLPCSCGGIVGFLNWPQHLALNIFLSVISIIGIFLVRRRNIYPQG